MHQRKSTAWTLVEDRALIDMRRRNIKWPDISKTFKDKTPNACRKRYERLVETSARERATSEIKNEPLGRAYKKYRREFWTTIAQDIGLDQDRWETVEGLAFQWGLAQLNIFERRSRKERDGTASSNGEQQKMSDSDDSDSILSDTTTGLSTMFQRAQLQASPQPSDAPSISRYQHYPGMPLAESSAHASSSYGHPSPEAYQQYSSPPHAYLPAPVNSPPKPWPISHTHPAAQRHDLRLPQPQSHYASQPEPSSYFPTSSPRLVRVSHLSEPRYSPPRTAVAKPGSIDSMLQSPARESSSSRR